MRLNPKRKRYLIIRNVAAGPGRQRLLGRVINRLNARGALITTQVVDGIEANKQVARDAAASGDFDCLIAAGGDSTIRGAATGLLGTDLPLGIVPVGTGNVMATELGLGRRARAIADTLIDGPTRTIHGGLANGEPFFLMAGVGFDAEVVSRLSYRWKKLLGKAAYGGPVLRTLAHPLPRLDVSVDEARHEARWVIVTNASRYGGHFMLSPDTVLDKPGLKAVLFQTESRAGLMRSLLRLASGRLEADHHVLSLDCEEVAISSNATVPLQIDGEVCGSTPVTITKAEDAFNLIVPSSFA